MPLAFRRAGMTPPRVWTLRNILWTLRRAAASSLAVAGVVLMMALSTTTADAQQAATGGPQRATRAELTKLLSDAEGRLAAGGRIDRNRVMAEIAALRNRLQEGDFRVGDQFVVTITHMGEVKADTASVRDSLLVSIAPLPDLTVRGVLRSELHDRMTTHVARYLRNATVRTNALTRVTVTGAVGRPGVYYTSPDRPVTELLMLAGGPGPDAKLDELEVARGTRTVLSRKDSKRAIQLGSTIEQMDIQSGDEVRIPQKRRINWSAILQVFAIATTLLFAVIQFLQFYYRQQEE